LQAMYFKTHATQNLPNFAAAPASLIPPFDLADLAGTGWGYGFTLGATIKPWAGTEIGLGYRSGVDVPISGALTIRGGAGTIGATSATTGLFAGTVIPAKLTFHLPDKLSLGVKQAVTDRFTLLAGYEFDHWSRMGNPNVLASAPFVVITTGGPVPAPAGSTLNTFQLHYKDGHTFSLGGEYAYNGKLTLRAGVSYEIAPIDDSNRQFILPDGDRIGLAAGFSYKVNDTVTLNAGYQHLFVRGGPATYLPPNYAIPFQANTKGGIDIVSVGLDVSLGGPPPAPAPLKAKF
ncbi:MAG: outer membrane protein transport protein, partial [Hyphomicrobiales bacterium]|nr:outer membrane protein transport protein [Hyphomicrobiales bacterium]